MSDATFNEVRLGEIDRNQYVLRPIDVDGLVGQTHPVRGIWEMAGRLDLRGYYEEIRSLKGGAGRSAHDPRLLISIWIYAYSEGIGSAREIARLCQSDPAFQWLTGLQEINHHSLSDFRVKHGKALEQLLVQVLGVLGLEGLVQLKRVTHDGTRIRACAGADSFRREDRLKAHLKMARRQVQKLTQGEQAEPSNKKKAAAQVRASNERAERLAKALEQLEEIRKHSDKPEEECRASWSDPDSRVMKHGDGGYGPSYNVQLSTDADSGIIVGVGVSQSSSDNVLLGEAIEQVEKTAGRLPEQLVVDGGFITADAIRNAGQKGVELIGPAISADQKAAAERRASEKGTFSGPSFQYVAGEDYFICAAGKKLMFRSKERRHGGTRYRYMARAEDCQACQFKKFCCPGTKQGRWLTRQVDDAEVMAFRQKMQTDAMKAIYKKRGAVAEFTNLWIKAKIGLRQFRVRGLQKVRTETLWACLTYNLQQWLRLCWRPRVLKEGTA